MTSPWIATTFAAATQRDGWDWLLYILSLLAAVAAMIGFTYWTLEQRRRPEAAIFWSFSPKLATDSLEAWPPDTVQRLPAKATVLVEVALRNVGDRAPADLLWNFIVPGSVQVKHLGSSDKKPLTAVEPERRLGPGDEIRFFAGTVPWPPGTDLALFFELTYQGSPGDPDEHLGRLVFEVADVRFSGGGRRWLPSFVSADETDLFPAGSDWPPHKAAERRLRRISAQPEGRLDCRAGRRQDVRDVVLTGE